MSRIVVVQHVSYEGPGRLALFAREMGHTLDVIHAYRGDPIPRSLGDARALILLGGPMGVYEAEQYPHLVDEMALARTAVASESPVLAICLGSQLLAAAHGADVRPSGQQEIGFADVTLARAAETDPLFDGVPRTFAPMHWHGDVFDLPRGATLLASSAMTAHQAFRLGDRAWGLLFHLEVDLAWLEATRIDPAVLRAHAPSALAAVEAVSRTVLTRFLSLVPR
jgi:GMP synthase (glutamine-hydrolysing)